LAPRAAPWRAIFWTLVGVGLATLAALFSALAHYGELFRHRRLLGYVGAGGFFYGGMFAYIAGTPFAYITYHHVPPQLYGLLFGIGVAGIMATNFANSRLVTRLGSDRLLLWGTSAAALAGTVLAVAAWMRVDPLFEAPVPDARVAPVSPSSPARAPRGTRTRWARRSS
jgi:MFS transporter, DHA1 family, multidrug resistance protein